MKTSTFNPARTSLFMLILLAALTGCNDEPEKQETMQWKKLGLDGKIINEMELHGDRLYAATDAGLFMMDTRTQESGFELIGFDQENTQSVLIFSDEILVSVVDRSASRPPVLYTTGDQGNTWNAIDDNFGGATPEAVYDMAVHPENDNIIYAVGSSVVAKSSDRGRTWHPIWGNWGGFATGVSVVSVNALKNNEIWAGGQGAIENGFLVRSANETSWNEWHDLVQAPTVVKEISFDKHHASHTYAGYEGALVKSKDAGTTWQTLISSEENRFFFGIAASETKADMLYAGGWLKTYDPQPLILYKSADQGNTWKEFTFAGESFGGIYDMKIKSGSKTDLIYLGLYKGGIYEVSIPHNTME